MFDFLGLKVDDSGLASALIMLLLAEIIEIRVKIKGLCDKVKAST